jgi:hypothetical protein
MAPATSITLLRVRFDLVIELRGCAEDRLTSTVVSGKPELRHSQRDSVPCSRSMSLPGLPLGCQIMDMHLRFVLSSRECKKGAGATLISRLLRIRGLGC